MVSGATIAAKVNYGLGKAGNAAGFPYSWYRPQGSGAPIVAGNLLGTVNAYISTSKSLQPQSSDWGKSDRFATFDPTNFLAGDYLVGQGDTLFVAELVPLAGMVRLVLCNEIFSWSRMGVAAPGPEFRRGVKVAAPVATGWPGWITVAERRSPPDLHLPGSIEMPNAQILLPATMPGQVIRGDELTTSETQAITWTVQGSALSNNGWQITAIRAGA
jgi:hypothetical protein